MKNSILIILFFISGILCGALSIFSKTIVNQNIITYALYILIFFIGIGVGSNSKAWKIVKKIHFKIVFVPLSVIIGTLLGAYISSFFISDIKLKDILAIGSGFGYYSLSSVLITKFRGESLGIIAFSANIIREIITLIMTPFFAHFFGKLAPIAAGGATSMDTTLPIITKVVGKEYSVISIFNGMFLTILVPFIITFIFAI